MRFRLRSRSATAVASVIFFTSYLLIAKAGQILGMTDGGFSVIWVPSGISLAALYLFGLRYVPVVWLSSFLAHATGLVGPDSSGRLFEAAAMGLADAVEASLGAFLIMRLVDGQNPCNKPRDAFKFTIFSGVVSCAIGAIIGAGVLAAAGRVSAGEFAALWTPLWLSHTLGVLLVVPAALGWAWDPRIESTSKRAIEVTIMWFVLLVATVAVFGGWVRSELLQIPVISLAILLLLWATMRFSQRTAATVTLVLSAIVIWGSVRGFGPFANDISEGSALVLQGFLGVLAMSSIGMAADIAMRKEIGLGLFRYKATSLQTADHWMITDVNGVVEEVNPSFERITGFTQEEIVGKPANFIKSGLHDPTFYAEMWQTILAGKPYRGVVVNKKRNGELFHEMKTITPIKNEHGRITHFLSIGKDITDLKIAEEELRGSAARLRESNARLLASEEALSHHLKILELVFNSMNEGVIVADQHGQFVMFNDAAVAMVGVGMTDSDPKSWSSRYGVFLPDTVTPCPMEDIPLYRAIQGYETDDQEYFIRNPVKTDGVWLRISGRPIREETGQLRGGVVVLKDVSQRKRAEKAELELEATRAELETARIIQTRLFPEKVPEISAIDIGGASRPAIATGGDYYDYFTIADGSIVFIVGDVSGHGLGPALIMASVRAYLHALSQSGTRAEDILTILNRLVENDTGPEDFVTLIYARLDPESRALDYMSAGHTTCYVLDRNGNLKSSLESTGPPLGVVPEARFEKLSRVALESGDIVLLLTDGVIEAECGARDWFGHERAIETVRRHLDKDADAIVNALLAEVDNYCELDNQDDITSIVIKVG